MSAPYESDESAQQRKWLARAVAAVVGGGFIFWAGMHVRENAFLLFPISGAAIALVWIFDVPQWLFSALDAARHKVQGVEHAGRHEWYGFKGVRVRVFLDEANAPWFAFKEIALILGINDPELALRHHGAAEAAAPEFANSEKCLSEAGLRRLLAHTQHAEVGAMTLWLEREVLFPLKNRKRA